MSQGRPFDCSCQSEPLDAQKDLESAIRNVVADELSEAVRRLRADLLQSVNFQGTSNDVKEILDILQMQHVGFQNLRSELNSYMAKKAAKSKFISGEAAAKSKLSGEAAAKSKFISGKAAAKSKYPNVASSSHAKHDPSSSDLESSQLVKGSGANDNVADEVHDGSSSARNTKDEGVAALGKTNLETTLDDLTIQVDSAETLPSTKKMPSKKNKTHILENPHEKKENDKALWTVHGWTREDIKRRSQMSKADSEKWTRENLFVLTAEQKRSDEPVKSPLQKMVKSIAFDSLCAIMIVANSFMIGFAANTQVNSCIEGHEQASCQNPPGLQELEYVFTVFFTFEIMARIISSKKQFVTSEGRNWNIFDTILVLTSLLDMIFSLLGNSFVNISFVRVLRVLRLIRIVRAVRVVRFFRELRVMVYSILECINSLISAMALLALVTYVFAVFITQHVADLMALGEEEQFKNSIYWHPDNYDNVVKRYGNLGRTMLSLYEAVTGGISWGELSGALMANSETPLVFGYIFALFIAFTGIALLNIVTGIFVDNAMKATQQDKDMVIHEELAREGSYMNDVKKMFQEADTDNSGELSWEELEQYLEDDRVKAYFNSLDLEPSAAKGLFKLLDTDGSNSVNCEEFVMGCARLKGGARSVDVATLMYENKKLMYQLSSFISECMGELKDMMSLESRIDDELVELTAVEKDVEQRVVEEEELIMEGLRAKAAKHQQPSHVKNL